MRVAKSWYAIGGVWSFVSFTTISNKRNNNWIDCDHVEAFCMCVTLTCVRVGLVVLCLVMVLQAIVCNHCVVAR